MPVRESQEGQKLSREQRAESREQRCHSAPFLQPTVQELGHTLGRPLLAINLNQITYHRHAQRLA